VQKIPLIELKSMCIRYSKNNGFHHNVKSVVNMKEWFKMFEIEFNKNLKDK